MRLPNPSRETQFSGANDDREMFIFPHQLTLSRIDNLTGLILTLAICDDPTYFCMTYGLEKLGSVSQNGLGRYLSALLLRTLGVGKRQQPDLIEFSLDMK